VFTSCCDPWQYHKCSVQNHLWCVTWTLSRNGTVTWEAAACDRLCYLSHNNLANNLQTTKFQKLTCTWIQIVWRSSSRCRFSWSCWVSSVYSYCVAKGSHCQILGTNSELPPSCLVETFALPQGLSGKPHPCMSFTLSLICQTCAFSPQRLSYTELLLGLAFMSLTPNVVRHLQSITCSIISDIQKYNCFILSIIFLKQPTSGINWWWIGHKPACPEIKYSHMAVQNWKCCATSMRITKESQQNSQKWTHKYRRYLKTNQTCTIISSSQIEVEAVRKTSVICQFNFQVFSGFLGF